MRVKIRELAHTRAGDKGDTSDISVFVYDDEHYQVLEDQITEKRIRKELAEIVDGPITRYELPNLNGFKFVIENALDGGVTTSLRLDPHGKSLSFAILNIEVEI